MKKRMRSKKKLSIKIITFAILGIICFAEGMIYYSLPSNGQVIESLLSRILASFQNLFQIMVFSPVIGVSDVEQIRMTAGFGLKIFQYFYMVALVVAPVMTVVTVWGAIQNMINKRWNDTIGKNEQVITVFGESEESEKIINSVGRDNALVYYIQSLTDEERQEYKERGIHTVTGVNEDIDSKFERYKLQQSKYIVLMDQDPVANFNMFCKVMKYFEGQSMVPEITVMVLCENYSIRKMCQDYYVNAAYREETVNNKKKRIPTKMAALDFIIIDPHELEAEQMLRDHPVFEYQVETYGKPDANPPADTPENPPANPPANPSANTPAFWNQHIVIMGFGHLGQEILFNAMNTAVLHSQSMIRFDVYDRDLDQSKGEFLKHFALNAFVHHEDCLELTGNGSIDGTFRIYFHEINVNTIALEYSLDQINKEMPVTYAAACFADDETSITAVGALGKVLSDEEKEHVPILLHLESNEELRTFINDDSKSYANVWVSTPSDSIFELDKLKKYADKLEVKEFHYLYKKLNDQFYDFTEDVQKPFTGILSEITEESAIKTWKSAEYIDKESNRKASLHQPVKQLRSAVYYYQKHIEGKYPELSFKQFFMEIQQKEHPEYAQDVKNELLQIFDEYRDVKELVTKINENEMLRELGAMEHRRWCSYELSVGFEYSENKNKAKRKHNDLLSWEELGEKNPKDVPYDFMGYFLNK